MSDAQPNPQVNAHAVGKETKFDVGWQKLTKQEFLEAVTVALSDKVQDLPSFQSATPASSNTPHDKAT